MLKKLMLLGVVSGIMAGIAGFAYQYVYARALGAGFEKIATVPGLFVSSYVGCMIAAFGYFVLNRFLGSKTEIVFNLLFTILTFVSIVCPFATKLPLDVEMPELFPGLAVPMHFFPAIAWYTLRPLFFKCNVVMGKIF